MGPSKVVTEIRRAAAKMAPGSAGRQLPKWVEPVNDPLTKKEQDAVRLFAQRGRPVGEDVWMETIAGRLNLESTTRPRGRQQVRSTDDVPIKDA